MHPVEERRRRAPVEERRWRAPIEEWIESRLPRARCEFNVSRNPPSSSPLTLPSSSAMVPQPWYRS